MAKGKRKTRRKNYRLKKSARWTIAGLLMATAIIVALIPVQNGGVSATSSDSFEISKDYLKLVYNSDPNEGQHAMLGSSYYKGYDGANELKSVVSDEIMSVSSNRLRYAYPYRPEDNGQPYIVNDSDREHVYYRIDTIGMTTSYPVPIYEMGKHPGTNIVNHVRKYIGDEGGYVPNGSIVNLGQSLIVNAGVKEEPYIGKVFNTANQEDADLRSELKSNSPAKGITKEGTYELFVEEEVSNNNDPGKHVILLNKVMHKVSIKTDDGGNPIPHSSGYGYEYNDIAFGQKESIGYFCKDSSLYAGDALLSQIDYIDDDAFTVGSATVSTVQIPSNIKAIGNRAFKGCGITSVDIDICCNFIGEEAFHDCTSLEKLNFSKSGDTTNLKFIGDCAFANTRIYTLKLPEAVSSFCIGSGAFAGCTNLGKQNLNDASDVGGVDFSDLQKCRNVTMGCYVFADCINLTSVDLKGVKTIVKHQTDDNLAECGIFANCGSLESVSIDDCFASDLPYGTFADCPNLRELTFDNPNAGFYHKENKIGDDYEMINDLTGLDDITVFVPKPYPNSESAKDAEDCAVTYAYGDQYNYFKQGIRYNFEEDRENGGYKIISADTSKAGDIDTIEFPNNLAGKYNITSIGSNVLMKANGKTDEKIEHIKIPDSIVQIDDNAFSNNKKLKTVEVIQKTDDYGVIPASPTMYLGKDVFKNCQNLTDIYFRHYSYNDKDGSIIGPVQQTIDFTFDPSVDTDLFNTGNTDKALTIHGSMYKRSDDPDVNGTDEELFKYCMDSKSGASSSNHHINYVTDGYELLTASEGNLLTYPTKDTTVTVGQVTTEVDGKEVTKPVQKTIEAIAKDKASGVGISQFEEDILSNFEDIYVPPAITSIDKASAYYVKRDSNGVYVTKKDSLGKEILDENGNPVYETEYDSYFQNLKGVDGTDIGTKTVKLANVATLPDGAFASVAKKTSSDPGSLNDITPSTLRTVYLNRDIVDMGEGTFANSKNVKNLYLSNDDMKADDQLREEATVSNPYYWVEQGVIFSYTGPEDNKTMIEECLPGTQSVVISEELGKQIDGIREGAFENCDELQNVDLGNCTKLTKIPDRCFYDCDKLDSVTLPESCGTVGFECFAVDDNKKEFYKNLNVYMKSHEIHIPTNAFDNRVTKNDYKEQPESNPLNTIHSYDDTAASRYADVMKNVAFSNDGVADKIDCLFHFWDANHVEQMIYVTVPNKKLQPSDDIFDTSQAARDGKPGYTMTGWDLNPYTALENLGVDLTKLVIFTAQYTENGSSPSTTPTPTPTPKPGTTTTPTPTPTSGGSGSSSSSTKTTPTPTPTPSSSSSSSSSSGSTGSSSSSTTTARPVVISGAPTPVSTTTATASPTTATATTGTTQNTNSAGSGVTKGNTSVVSSMPGIHGDGQMSATVNGSSDNYIIKISETREAEEMAAQALGAAFASLDNIRYMPFDISLYDSTGTQKITPVPEGVTVSVTMPIPDDLAIYGGNNKIASTKGGTLETIKPRFTVIDGVPCMNYTVSHLSPYVVYVDTANLTDAGVMDATPKTGDPIHPKWFLCIGLAAISIFMFLKRDKKPVRTAA